MKKITEKNFIQKIVITIFIVLLSNFIIPTFSQASFGGVLLGPIVDLITSVADSVVGGLQKFMYNNNSSFTGLFDGFLGQASEIEELKIKNPDLKYDDSEGNAKYTINSEDLDRGWFANSLSGLKIFGTVNGDNFGIPIIKYSPEKIFSGEVPSLDVNFINPKYSKTSDGRYPTFTDTNGDGKDDTTGASSQEELNNMVDKSITYALRKTISNWYNALRNLAVVGLLSVLLYVGIRIVMSSTAADKAKYKQMIMDWVIALCLLFFLHYIMSFTLTMIEMVTEGIGQNNKIAITVTDTDGTSDSKIQFNTDLMGFVRFQVQYADLGIRVLYMILYICLTVYTVVFTWKYVKRSITMAFLTLMAPIVALTYPIDKMNDGKAQAFNMWLKEYIFNALLQPFHLIIYTIFLGSAMDIAVQNPIYAILFLAFIGPAEKLLRKFFGFDKAATVGALDSAAGMFGGAAAFKMLNKAMSRGGKGGKGARGNDKIRTQNQGKLEDPNTPKGYGDYVNTIGNEDENNESRNIAPDMLEQYDSNYGTDEWDPQERQQLAREANQGESIHYSNDELAQIYRDAGYNDDEVESMIRQRNANITGGRHEEEMPSQIRMQELADRMEPSHGVENVNREAHSPERPEPESRMDTIKRGIKNKATSAYKNKLTNRKWWANQGANAAKFAGRAAVRTITGGAIGAVGIGMGMAGNDLEDVLTYGAAGAALGATVGGNTVLGGVNKITAQAQDIWHGSHQEAELARQRSNLQSDRQFVQNVQENYQPKGEALQGKELDSAVERASTYYGYGITDAKQIEKTMKLEDKIKKEMAKSDTELTEEQQEEFARNKATIASKFASKLDDKVLRDPKATENLKASFVRGIQSNGVSKKEAEKNADELIRHIRIIKKID